jgi:opacity protein-like surface antigen
MKKIILTALTSSIFVASSSYAEKDKFYAKGQLGWMKLDQTKSGSAKLKSSNSAFFGLGFGYYIKDNIRADVTYDYYVNPTQKGTTQRNFSLKYKSQASTLMVNGFVDLFDINVSKIFAGAGVGVSAISAKTTLTFANNKTSTDKSKAVNNFAYALHLGSSIELAPGINADVTYSYKDMGKYKKSEKIFSLGGIKGHHISVGARFDI